MDIELLAKLMREKALLEDAGELQPTHKINQAEIELAKKQKLAKLEELKNEALTRLDRVGALFEKKRRQ